MKAVRARLLATTCSFRFPHFLVGRQPTYDVPPPSTIHGLVAAALGRLLEPPSADLRFAYRFHAAARVDDLEHQHKLLVKHGKRTTSAEIKVEPVRREVLCFATLDLYLASPSLHDELLRAFRSPAFALSLGRSQDLAEMAQVEAIDLEPASSAYYEGTLLPFSWRPATPRGITALLPHLIGPPPEREAVFQRYIVLRERVYAGANPSKSEGRVIAPDPAVPTTHSVDPTTEPDGDARLGLAFHAWAS